MQTRALWPALVLLLAVPACGSGRHPLSKEEYQRRAHAILTRLDESLKRNSLVIANARSVKGIREPATRLTRSLESASRRLDRLAAPEEVASANDRLADALERYGREVGESRRVSLSGSAEELREFQEHLDRSRAAVETRHLIGEIEDAGYDLGV